MRGKTYIAEHSIDVRLCKYMGGFIFINISVFQQCAFSEDEQEFIIIFLLIMPFLVGECCTEDLTLVLFKYCSLYVTLQNGCCLYLFQLFAAWYCWLGYSKFVNRLQQRSPGAL